MERPSAKFYFEKYSVLNNFCYAGFLALHTWKYIKTSEYQSDELDDVIENNHGECFYSNKN